MAFAFVHANNARAAGATSVAVSLAVTAANMVTGGVTWDNSSGETLSSITDNGTGGTWVIKQTTNDTTNTQANASIYGYGWSVAPTTITANFAAGTPFESGITVQEFSGQASGDPIDGTNFQSQVQTAPGTGTDGAKSGSGTLTPSTDNCLVVGFGVDTGAQNNSGASEFTAGTNFTEGASAEHQTNGQLSFSCEYWIQTTATAANASWTVTRNTAHATFMMVFKPVGGGGGGTFVPLVGGPGGVAGMPLAGVGGGLVG